MAISRTPVGRHQRTIAEELRRLRRASGLTLQQVGAKVGCSYSKISRIENAQRACGTEDLRRLLAVYAAPDETARRLLLLTGEKVVADDRWWHGYLDVLSASYAEYVNLENEAASATEYVPLLVPGLLQTEAYSAAVTLGGAPGLGDHRMDALVRVRMRRQERLFAERPIASVNFLTEAALRVEVGGRHVLHDQLCRLLELAGRDNVTIRVVPNSAGALGALTSGFTLFGFPGEGKADVVSVEAVGGALLVDDPEGVARFRSLVARLRRNALSVAASSALIARVRDENDR